MHILAKKILAGALIGAYLASPFTALADSEFNPSYIISDAQLQDYNSWTKDDIQQFLESKGSYLSTYLDYDENNNLLPASAIIYQAAQNYQINPKFLLVTLQKEQSLVTDDSPTQRQLDWATGYAVCDGCMLNDPKVQKYKGFGKQVAGAAGIMRWYYQNEDKTFVKKEDIATQIDDTMVIPQSWATAFLYTYTPHLHGNKNFARIWDTWFSEAYPNGTLLKSASSTDYWLIQDGKRRKFSNLTAVITRTDPKLAITVDDVTLNNYSEGAPIAFANYSLLRTASGTYLLDYDTLRPFASDEVVKELGYNPEEIVDVDPTDIAGLTIGDTITASSTAPQGVIYQITDLNNTYYLLKDGVVYPITDKQIIDTNFKNLAIEKHKLKDLKSFSYSETPLTFRDGTLLQSSDSNTVYVIDNGKKRRIADNDTFRALGYKRSNITTVSSALLITIPEGDKIYTNSSLLSSKDKFLGDSAVALTDQFKTDLPGYLVAEYPSGRLISGKNIDSPEQMGSLSSLLIAYESLQDGFELKKTSTFDDRTIKAQKNSLSLVRGDKLKNTDLFNTLLLTTPKDVAHLVAQNTTDGEISLVNDVMGTLDDWGADNTVFKGTDAEDSNLSTPRDLLKITTKVLDDNNIATALGLPNFTVRKVVAKGKSTTIVKNSNSIITSYPLAKRNYKILATTADTWGDDNKPIVMVIESKKTKKQYTIITFGTLKNKQPFDELNKIATWISSGDVKVASK